MTISAINCVVIHVHICNVHTHTLVLYSVGKNEEIH